VRPLFAADNLLDPPLKLHVPENKSINPILLRIAILDSQPCARSATLFSAFSSLERVADPAATDLEKALPPASALTPRRAESQ
jgi:hypothetical protein